MADLSPFELLLDKLIASSHHSARRCRKPDRTQEDGHGRGRQIPCGVPGPAVANLLIERSGAVRDPLPMSAAAWIGALPRAGPLR